MPISIAKLIPAAVDVRCQPFVLSATLADGREISAPMEWLPRLRDAAPDERARWQDIDEDVSVGALPGAPS
jgi:hypothetical protein